jgi:outer membrane protein
MKTGKWLLFLLIMFGTYFANGQKYAYIDSDYILKKMPEYQDSKEKIEELYETLKTKKDNFAKEEVLLPEEEKNKRSEEIKKLEQDAVKIQTSHFGVNGDYFQKRQELIKPIQDKVFEAMQKVAQKKGYSFVFDKSNQSNLVYAETKFDLSNDVLKEMGISIK